MIKRLAATAAATAALTLGGALLASPAQAGGKHYPPAPEPVQNSVQRTVNLEAGEGCEFPVRIVFRIRDLDVERRAGRVIVDADGVRAKVINLRNGETFRYSGDTRLRINRFTRVIRGDGEQLLLLDRTRRVRLPQHDGDKVEPLSGKPVVRPRQVNRLFFTEDETRGPLRERRGALLPTERLLESDDLVNVCAEIRGAVRPGGHGHR